MKSSQRGSTVLVVLLVFVVVLLLGAIGFGWWAYQERQDYKNNTNQKVAIAVNEAEQAVSDIKDKEFAEQYKKPLRTYVGPAAFGRVNVQYPKTWSAYVSTHSDSAPFIDGYFAPSTVPDIEGEDSVFALRIRVSGDSYSTIMSDYQGNVQDHTATVTAYKLPQVPGVVGSKITGQLANEKNGTLIVLPLRANALEIWTESDRNLDDFNKYILPNLTFSP